MARKIIKRLESLHGGWAPGSHGRRVLLALWWLQLAHALCLSLPIDMEKALTAQSLEYHDILSMEESE
jgi:hypothetical protein